MAKYTYSNTIAAHTTAKSSDVITEFQAVQAMSVAEEIRADDAIKFPADEGNDIRITENPAQRIGKVITFGASGEILLKSTADASVIVDASGLPIDDSGNYFTESDAEAALQELGASVDNLVILDSPELLESSITVDAWTSSSGFSSATLASAGATKAIIRINASIIRTSTTNNGYFSTRKAGTTVSAVDSVVAKGNNTAATPIALIVGIAGNRVVNLDSNSDFEYYMNILAGGTFTGVDNKIWLDGYYVPMG